MPSIMGMAQTAFPSEINALCSHVLGKTSPQCKAQQEYTPLTIYRSLCPIRCKLFDKDKHLKILPRITSGALYYLVFMTAV